MLVSSRDVPALVALLMLACSAEGHAVQGNTPLPGSRRSEAGVTIVEHGRDALTRAPRIRIETRPVAVIGGADGDDAYDLTSATQFVLLSDGGIATLAGVGNRLLVFGPDGKGRRNLGRTGQGPGELMAPGGMIALRGDTLFIPDMGNARVNYFHPRQGFLSSTPVAPSPLTRAISPLGVLGDGRVVAGGLNLLRDAEGEGITRPPAPVILIDRSPFSVRQLLELPGFEVTRIETRFGGRPRMATRPVRLGRYTSVAVLDTSIVVGSADGYRIDLHGPDGRLRSSIRVAVPRRPVTRAMRDAIIARELEQLRAPASERMIDPEESRRLARETPFADSLPHYGVVRTSPAGVIWVVDYTIPPDIGWAATAFRADGAIVGRVESSIRGVPVAFGDDRVVLRSTDDDGVVSLSIHRLIRP